MNGVKSLIISLLGRDGELEASEVVLDIRYTEAAPILPDNAPNDNTAITGKSSVPVDLQYVDLRVSYVPISMALYGKTPISPSYSHQPIAPYTSVRRTVGSYRQTPIKSPYPTLSPHPLRSLHHALDAKRRPDLALYPRL